MKTRLSIIPAVLLALLLTAGACRKDAGTERMPSPEKDEEVRDSAWWAAKTYPYISLTTSAEILGPTRHGKDVDKSSYYVPGRMLVNDPDGFYSDSSLVEATLLIRWRGHSTLTCDKKSYRIKLDEKHRLLDMNSDRDWYLLANHPDKTLMRNMVAMRISKICGMGWTPKMKPVEVWFNGDYIGNYMLSEHKEVNDNKVNIHPAGPKDIEGEALTGDYYFEIESDMDQPAGFWTPVYREPVMFRDPEEPVQEQIDYCREYFTAFEKALRDGDFSGDAPREYLNYIDLDSFVNHYIVQEFCKPVDVLRKSTFLTKTRGGKLAFCHVWDFDLALGNCSYLHADPGAEDGPEGWWVKTIAPWRMKTGWYLRLFEDPQFCAAVKARWNEVKGDLAGLPDYIDKLQMKHRRSFDRNFERWPVIGTNIWPNSWPEEDLPVSYDGEVELLRNFCIQRWNWLDENINKL